MLESKNPTAIQSQKCILSSFLDLLDKKSYHDITVKDICKNALLDRRTFYRNFDSKDDVLEFQISILSNEYIETLSLLEHKTVYTITRCYFEFWLQNIHFLKLLYRDKMIMYALSISEQYLSKIRKHMYGDTDEDIDYALAFQTGGFISILVKWLSMGAEKTPDEMAQIVVDITGHKYL